MWGIDDRRGDKGGKKRTGEERKKGERQGEKKYGGRRMECRGQKQEEADEIKSTERKQNRDKTKENITATKICKYTGDKMDLTSISTSISV